jgi:HD superfamily phosphohydrolase
MQTATRAFEMIFQENSKSKGVQISPASHARFRCVLRLCALLHDIGHGPFSHATEIAMPPRCKLNLPVLPSEKLSKPSSERATHEDYTLKMILDSELTPLLEKAGAPLGFRPIHIAGVINPQLDIPDDFFFDQRIDFRPILSQLISSELDADRMDYLRRDSLHTGVSYGQFDFEWLVGNLTSYVTHNKCYLSLQHRALYTFEDFLISRFHMFLMVYFHQKCVVYDEMLRQYFSSPDCDYVLPDQIEKYCELNDGHLSAHLTQSSNVWAQGVAKKAPYRVLIELHSGIPFKRTSKIEQQRLLEEVQDRLNQQKIHFLLVTSTSELSKYFQRPANPIFVHYDNHYSPPSTLHLEQCTDLFQRYSEKRSITRIYVSPEDYPRCRLLRP